MKKKFICLSLIVAAIACFYLSGCSNEYYGTYRGGLGVNETITINKTLKYGTTEYNYEIKDSYLKLTQIDSGKVTDLYSFENGNILAFNITYSFDSGTIPVRDGYFTASLYKFKSNFSLSFSYMFESDGTYRYVDPVYPLASHSGTYELVKGVLTLKGAMSLGKEFNEIFYIKSPYLMYYGVFVKDGFLTKSSQSESGQKQTYTITYTASEGGRIQGSTGQTVNANGNGTSVTAVANEGYDFIGWSDGVMAATRQETNVNNNINVTANFRKKQTYTITYTASEGGWIQGSTGQTVNANGNGTSVTAVANEGYDFIGWSDGVMAATRQETNVNNNINVTANFRKKQFYSVSFVFYDDNNSQQSMRIEKDSQIKLPEPFKTGYSFKGWQVGNDVKQAGDVFTVTANVTLYAKWQIDTYTITYNLNGGSLKEAKTQFTINDLPLTLQTPEGETEDLSFTKWATDDKGNNEIATIEKSKENLKDFTLYAFYEESSNFLQYRYDSDNQGYNVIEYTGNAKKVTIPSTYKNVPVVGIVGGFCESNVVSVTIPDSVKEISSSFGYCSLSEVIIPSSVETIYNSFGYCSSLSEVTIPDSVKEISGSFEYCFSLSEVIIPSGVETIYDSFYYCSSLSEVTIPDSVKEISDSFRSCFSLSEVIIPSSVQTIFRSFWDCSSLSEVTIPSSVKSLFESFSGCESLKTVYTSSTDSVNSSNN